MARVIPREQHGISRKNISPNALRVLYRLNEAGFEACLVGGAVRDLLLGGHPKDFDVATSATPEQVRHLFRNCRLIGRRFRLAHVIFGPEIIEVATYRASGDDGTGDRHLVDGRIVRDNVYGSIEEGSFAETDPLSPRSPYSASKAGSDLIARLPRHQAPKLVPGDPVWCAWSPEHAYVFSADQSDRVIIDPVDETVS